MDLQTADSRPLEFDALEAELVGVFAGISAATHRFLTLLAEYDGTARWRSWGFTSLAAWVSFQCGISESAAREQVRVARALPRFPLISEAFSRGRLSYSKVRAITRVVSEDTESVLLDVALYATAAQLDQVVAAQRRVVRAEDAEERRQARFLAYHWDSDGSLVGSFRLPPEDGAVLIAAVEGMRQKLAGTPTEARLRAAAEDTSAEGSACGVAENTSAEVYRAAEDPDDAVDAIERPSPPARLADALVALAGGRPSSEGVSLVVHATPEALARSDDDDSHDPALLGFALGHSAVRIHPEVARRLTCGCSTRLQIDGEHGQPLHLGRRTRRISKRLAAAIHFRDHGRCRAPGCRRRTAEIHHIQHWSRGGPTCIDNLISLCDQHHWLVHDGGWTLVGPAMSPTFARPDGRAVSVIPAPRQPRPFAVVTDVPRPFRRERLDLHYAIAVVNQ